MTMTWGRDGVAISLMDEPIIKSMRNRMWIDQSEELAWGRAGEVRYDCVG
jgi:hypothetical protein